MLPKNSIQQAPAAFIKNYGDKDSDKEADKEVNKKLWRAFLDWCEVSTTHGLCNLARVQNKITLILWLITFLASVAYCSYTIISILINYLSYQVVVNMQVVHSTPIEFPAVTICNLNSFDRNKAKYYINETLKREHLDYVWNLQKINFSSPVVLDLIKASLAANKSMTVADRMYYGFDIKFMLVSCSFNGVKCDERDFVALYDFDYTTCYTFNSGRNGDAVKLISEYGSDIGLRVELFLGEEADQGKFMSNSGARVVVHNQSVTPIINQEGKDMATNYQSNIGIKRTFTSKLGPPYSDCIENNLSPDSFDSHYYRAIFNILNMTTYKQQTCKKLCLQKHVYDQCQCIDGSLPNIYGNSVEVCSSLEKLRCVKTSQNEYFETASSTSCSECPLECKKVTYDLSFSSSRYPTIYYTDYLRYKTNILSKLSNTTTITDYSITKNIVLINVFYDSIATTYVEEVAMITSDYILGNIGGNLGLFVGMSALSFIEIIEIGIFLLLMRRDEKKKQKANKMKSGPIEQTKY